MKKIVIFGVLVAVLAAVAFNSSVKNKNSQNNEAQNNIEIAKNEQKTPQNTPDAVNENVQVASKAQTQNQVKAQAKEVKTADVLKLIATDKTLVIIDARKVEGVAQTGIIPNAKSLPADQVTAEALAKVAPNKNGNVVFYCSGPACSASKIGGQKAVELGYTNILEYTEGVEGWKKAGNKTEAFKVANTSVKK